MLVELRPLVRPSMDGFSYNAAAHGAWSQRLAKERKSLKNHAQFYYRGKADELLAPKVAKQFTAEEAGLLNARKMVESTSQQALLASRAKLAAAAAAAPRGVSTGRPPRSGLRNRTRPPSGLPPPHAATATMETGPRHSRFESQRIGDHIPASPGQIRRVDPRASSQSSLLFFDQDSQRQAPPTPSMRSSASKMDPAMWSEVAHIVQTEVSKAIGPLSEQLRNETAKRQEAEKELRSLGIT